MNGSPIPVTLLAGFLGSGKMTQLNYLLRQVPLTAVLMNGGWGAGPADAVQAERCSGASRQASSACSISMVLCASR